MFGRSTTSFDRLVERATSQLLLEPDWDTILQLCDAVRQEDVQAKYAVAALKKKVSNENPHVSMFALQALESVVKNCGTPIHEEVATKEFMEFLKDFVKVRSDPVKSKILELLQIWSHAFRNSPRYKAVQDTFHLMKMEGYTFPMLKEADAMFVAEKAPEWKDGEVCHRCRVQFTVVQRKHHCRNCGEVFCGKCTSKSSIIPKYGIEREVRVCEACFETLTKLTGGKKGSDEDLPAEYLSSPLAQQSQLPPSKSEAELQEEEELQLAIALSQSEAESKERERNKLRSGYSLYGSNNSTKTTTSSPAIYSQPTVTAPVIDTSDMDPELARYLNRNYWEGRVKREDSKTTSATPSAPTALNEPKNTPIKVSEKYQNGEVDDEEQFLKALYSSIEIFVNRMKSNSQRGRSIANDSSVQTLFMTLNAMHPQLMKYVGQQEDARAHYEGLQDRLAQIRDAREALDALREEYREKKRREMEELERQRQIQMAQKLEIMRQKKQEYLEYQRQLALQRMQEQEREMQMRLEQQKHMQQVRAMQQYGFPQVYGQPPPPQGYSPAGSTEGSPLHRPPGPYTSLPPQPQPGLAVAPPPQGVSLPPMGAQPPGSNGAPAPAQPMYNQGAFPQGQGPPPPSQAPVGYPTPPPGGFPAGYQPPGAFHPANTQAQGYPAQPPPTNNQSQAYPAQPPPTSTQNQTYPAQPQMDYGAFNMQGMAGALPPQGAGQPGQPPYIPPQSQGQYPQQPQTIPPGPPQQQQPPPPPPQQQQPPQPQANEAELISFD